MDLTTTLEYCGPHEPGYVTAAAAWNLAFRHRPGLVALPTTADDVVAAVREAERFGLGVAVQSTGHGPAAEADERSLLINLSRLDHVVVDPHLGLARIGGGATWAPVLAAAQDHGLAPLLGSAPNVGVAGYTLGGGSGWLAREHGLSVDHVRSLDVVVAGGSLLTASAEENSELFWALLGGGAGTLGVVVELTVELVPVTDVYAGNLLYPAEAAGDVFSQWREWVRDAPTELTSAFTMMTFPPVEDVPPPLRGQTFCIVRGCHCGDPDEAAAQVDHWRRWRAPAMDLWGPMPFREIALVSQDPVDPLPALTTGRWLTDADAGVGDAMVDAVAGGALFVELRHAGGAVARPNPAVSHAARDGEFLLEAVSLTPTPAAWTAARATLDQLVTATRAHHAELPAYLNFLEGEERRSMVTQAFDPGTLSRLARVKERVDPAGLFGYGADV